MNRLRVSLALLILFGLVAPLEAQFLDGLNPPVGNQPRATVKATLSTNALQPGQQAVLAVVVEIRAGLHAQSHTPLDRNLIPLTVTMAALPAVDFLPPVYPPGQIETYPALGKLSVYTGQVIVYVPFKVKSDAAPGPLTLTGTAGYQICDNRTCFAPQTTPFTVDTKVIPIGQAVTADRPELFKDFDPRVFATSPATAPSTAPTTTPAAMTPQPSATQLNFFGLHLTLGQDSLGLALLVAFLAGILFNVMPCVLPVLPLKAISFYEVAQHDRTRSVLLSLVFGLGIIATFAALAMLVLVLRTFSWGEQFANPWFVWSIVAILLVMGLGMFGAFSLRLPVAVYNLSPRHDTYSGNFLFGLLAAILSTPCTAPMFPPLLLWASTQSSVAGVASVLMVGVGMAFPYILLSAFPELARRFPRTGPFAELVKQMMAFLLIGAAAYFAGGRLFQGARLWWLVLAVAIVAAIFLIIRTAQLTHRIGALAAAGVVALLVVCIFGYTAARFNLPQFAGTGSESGTINWQPYSLDALASARDRGQVVLIDFTANWCGNCQYLDATVFQDPRTIDAVRRGRVVALRADLTRDTAPGWPLLKQLSPTGGIPLTAIYHPGGDEPLQLASVYTTQTLVDALSLSER